MRERPAGDVRRLLHRRPQMGACQAEDVAGVGDPSLRGLLAVVACAPHCEPAHRVAEQHHLIDRHRPPVNDVREQSCEASPVLGDAQAGVAAQAQGREAEVPLQPRAVVIRFVTEHPPRLLGSTQPVDEHRQARGRLWEGFGQAGSVNHYVTATPA
jgi:hypothetical protein